MRFGPNSPHTAPGWHTSSGFSHHVTGSMLDPDDQAHAPRAKTPKGWGYRSSDTDVGNAADYSDTQPSGLSPEPTPLGRSASRLKGKIAGKQSTTQQSTSVWSSLGWVAFLLLVAFVLAMVCAQVVSAQTLPAQPPDNNGGTKAHTGYSVVIGGTWAALAPDRPLLAWGGCLAIGVAKEASDYSHGQPGYRHGLFSRRDLAADLAGCTLGVVAVHGLQVLIERRRLVVGLVREF